MQTSRNEVLYAEQFIPWIPRFGINVILELDGLSLLMAI